MRRLPIVVLSLAALVAQQTRPRLLVSTAWLAANLGRPGAVVLHVTRDPATYFSGHIPGARLLAWDRFTTTRGGVPNELPLPAELAECFAALGVSDRATV
ncbi:MAG: hypothetical protein ACPL88_09480, partial [Bryobacteraceae bacterium]